jgi:hypothetical protein
VGFATGRVQVVEFQGVPEIEERAEEAASGSTFDGWKVAPLVAK